MRALAILGALTLLAGVSWWLFTTETARPAEDPGATLTLEKASQARASTAIEALPRAEPREQAAATVETAIAPAEDSHDRLDVLVTFRGLPIEGAAVRVWEPPDQIDETPPTRSARSDSRGRCHLSVSGPRGKIRGEHAGEGAATTEDWDRARSSEVTLELRPVVRVSGRVLWPNDQPAQEAIVRKVGDGRRGPIPSTGIPANEQGEFELLIEPNTAVDLVAQVENIKSPPVRVFGGAGQWVTTTLYLPGAFRIEGTVDNDVGFVLPDVTVVVWHLAAENASIIQLFSAGSSAQQSRLETDLAGYFGCDVPGPGRYEVIAEGPHRISARELVTLDTGQRSAQLQLTLPTPQSITGRVVRADGRVLPGVRVRAEPDVLDNPYAVIDQGPSRDQLYPTRSTQTDSLGAFTLDRLHPGVEYRLRCQPDSKDRDSVAWVRHVPPGTRDVEIVVDEQSLQGARLQGRVVSGRTGQPVGSFELQVTLNIPAPPPIFASGGFQKVSVDDPNGEFLVTGLVPGERYALRVETEGFPVRCVDPVEATLEKSPLEIVVDVAGSLDVRASTSFAGLGVSLSLLPPLEPKVSQNIDASGNAHFDELPFGRYTVMIRREAELLFMGEVAVVAGEVTVFEID